MEGGFIATYSDLVESFLSNDRKEISNHFFGRIESPDLFGLNNNMPGPAKKTFQTTSHTVSSGNPSIKRSRTKAVISPLLSRTDDLSNPFS